MSGAAVTVIRGDNDMEQTQSCRNTNTGSVNEVGKPVQVTSRGPGQSWETSSEEVEIPVHVYMRHAAIEFSCRILHLQEIVW